MRNMNHLYSGQKFWGRYASTVISAWRGMENIFRYYYTSKPDERGYEGVIEYFYEANSEKPNDKIIEVEDRSTGQPTVVENETFKVIRRKYARVDTTIH